MWETKKGGKEENKLKGCMRTRKEQSKHAKGKSVCVQENRKASEQFARILASKEASKHAIKYQEYFQIITQESKQANASVCANKIAS